MRRVIISCINLKTLERHEKILYFDPEFKGSVYEESLKALDISEDQVNEYDVALSTLPDGNDVECRAITLCDDFRVITYIEQFIDD